MIARTCRSATLVAGLVVASAAATHADIILSSKGSTEITEADRLGVEDAEPVPAARLVPAIIKEEVSETFVDETLRGLRPVARPITFISHTKAFLDAQPVATGGSDWECLSEALYFEARGESVEGLFAVAEVILNRVDNARFPDTVCEVVNQGTGRIHECQFSYTCDGMPEVVREKEAFRKVGKVARLMLDGGERTLTEGAEFYHTRAVRPRWSQIFDRTTTIGAHHFYARG
ncbi:cell wall hydrolase [Palleronia sp. LCG004]|uniref:cell wall hydrolase n=1 Tax=Palleronia sp. LCG004 TaxID=3079304 RepID=UPI0029423868|nr:cell wall hydrolase [Palleronia sp. LCG004]WOI57114.1 cell wall hydrolase [Palleronia sp. LCG004]